MLPVIEPRRVGDELSPQSMTTSRIAPEPVAGATVNVAAMPASMPVVGGVMVTPGEATVISTVSVTPPAVAETLPLSDPVKVVRAWPVSSVAAVPGDT